MAPKCLDPHDPNANYLYCPSFAAAVAFSALFGITLLAHFVLAIIYRKKFCWVIIMAAGWETAGFITRSLSVLHQTESGYVIPSQLLIILAPLWVNAFVYMILGRMILYFVPDQKMFGISAKWFSLIFVLLDITAFLAQGAGGSMMSGENPPQTVLLGTHIYMGGIGGQEFFICLFSILAIAMQRRLQRLDTDRTTNWRPLLYAMYAALLLITVRVIFRLCEFSQGIYSTITMHEGFFYGLEAVPMLLAIGLFTVIHPGTTLVGPESEFPKKVKKSKKKDVEEIKLVENGSFA